MRRAWIVSVGLALLGCGESAAGVPSGPTSSRGVTQGGAQDIAHFRSIVARGEVPQPDTIEPVGFFAEHQVDLPPADCGDRICMHAMLAVAPGIDRESNWTMAFVALNSPVDPSTLERPPTHVAIVVERSVRTNTELQFLHEAVRRLTGELREGDRVSVVRVGNTAEVLLAGVEPSDPNLTTMNALGWPDERAALYDGLATAAELTTGGLPDFEGAHRVLLVTSGVADAGITDPSRIVALGEALAQRGVGVSVVGVGSGYRPELPMQLSEAGGGSYAYADSFTDLERIFALEGRTSLFPLATGFELVVEAAPGYRVGRIYGARRAWAEQAAAHLASPVLMLGNRTGASDVEQGRRGGGGGLFVELIADASLRSAIGPNAPAFTARARWTDAASGAPVEQELVIRNGLAPGEIPSGMFPHFSDPARGKAFMMLNMYLSLRTSTELFHGGTCAQALGIVPAMEETYRGWQDEFADPDIDADWALLLALDANLHRQCTGVEPVAPQAPMSCFYD